MMDINVTSTALNMITNDSVTVSWTVSYVEIDDTTFGIATPPVTAYGQLVGPGNVDIIPAVAGKTRQAKNINFKLNTGQSGVVSFRFGASS